MDHYLWLWSLKFSSLPFIPIILAKAASTIPEISAVTCLRWPQLSYSMIVCQCLSLLGYFLNVVPNFLHFGRTAFLQKNLAIFIATFIALLLTAYTIFCFFICQIIVFSWLEYLGFCLDQLILSGHIQKSIAKYMEMYSKLEKALGFYFFFMFASQQFSWIFSLYLSICGLLDLSPEVVAELHGSLALIIVKSIGMFLISVCCLWHLFHMVLAVENLRKR